MRRIGLLTLAGVLLVGPAAWGQGSGLAAGALAYRAEYRLRYLGQIHDQSGVMLGGEGGLRLGPLRLGLSGYAGKLTGEVSAANPERTLRSTTVALGLRPVSWLDLGAEATARVYESDLSTVVWRLLGPRVALDIPLGLDGLSGTAAGAYYPKADVTGSEKLNLALRAEVGVSYAPPSTPLTLRLAYRFESYDFDASGTTSARLEQVRGVVAGLGLRLGR